ncbi:DUF3438 family protein, partial [Bacillus velezensis]|nr:DUF3438 family protein [Bacillus velezensis]
RYGDQPGDDNEAPARAQDQAGARAARRETPVPVVLTRFAAQNLYAPLRTVEPLPGVMRVNLRRDLDLGTLMPTLPVRAVALALLRFSPCVALDDEATLIVDVGPSLRLFGGLPSLCRQVCATLATLGYAARLSAAPTGRGAWLLARTSARARSR